ncbi:MYXO-CTERM sorting domain-containing protein [Nannocystis punicea]|uniref:MYXO-CTERM sorting domain-containing protein n=1 Tax=Nannocystis punicea TaxID=2995304 RepID=A0ABY7HAB3_9BACT|nr:MYXO-CTERM sorting domain-containing protein [Nannocystis poenicansa]WAS96047.1 MYXO-CTERM sorting domain-containing protein [Nannocystis poenicansa]
MASLGHFTLGCSFAFALMSAARPAGAVTTGETDTDDPPPVGTITIVEPLDGEVFTLSPGEENKLIEVTIEWTALPAHEISLHVDGEPFQPMCPDLPPCVVDVLLDAGEHKLVATGISDPATSNEVTVQVVETGEGPDLDLEILKPADGAVFVGSPDAVVPVTIAGDVEEVELLVDGAAVDVNCDALPCHPDVTLAPGQHQLVAQGIAENAEGFVIVESPAVNVEVTVDEEATDGAATDGAATDGATSDSPTEGSASEGPATDGTDGSGSDGSGSDSASGGDQDDDKGCGCNAGPSGLDVLGLAAVVLLGPWGRRRRR